MHRSCYTFNSNHPKHRLIMNRKQAGMYWPVFIPAFAVMLIFLGMGVFFPNILEAYIGTFQEWVITNLGWFYILGVALILGFCLFLMVSRLGDIKLGLDHTLPEHGYLSWFTMLFAAGMGIGLMFFGVAEPLMHYLAPPASRPESVTAAKHALEITFFHWGLHAWGVYSLIALALAYFSYRHQLPLLPRSALYPILGQRIYGPIGHAADVFAIIGTIFGVATSLGLGVSQINAGLHYLFNVPVSISVQIGLIALIIATATVSVVLGLDKGIKNLSNFNLALATLLMLFLLFTGPTIWLLKTFVQDTGTYFNEVISKTFNLYAYQQTGDWVGNWTLFYWGWWISWCPFVGMFIAKVSRGRTIREFMVGVLFVPIGFTFLWMTVFGNSAINMVMTNHADQLAHLVQDNLPVALFEFLHHYPLASLTSFVAVILVIIFFVTSADSGALVVDILATGNAPESLPWQRVFWTILIGLISLILLYSGGLKVLQTITLMSALPLLFVLFLIGYSLIKALRADYLKGHSVKTYTPAIQYGKGLRSWKTRLDYLVPHPNREEVATMFQQTIPAAMHEVGNYLEDKGLQVRIDSREDVAKLLIHKAGSWDDFVYGVEAAAFPLPEFSPGVNEDNYYYRAEVFLREGSQYYDIMGYSKEQIIADIISQYEKHMYYLHLTQETYEGN